MSVILTQKDWLLISAFLDGRLSDADKTIFESRLDSNADLRTAFQEIKYTRRLLRSLPQKRAPRNFTLPAEYAQKKSLKWGLNRFFGFASAASAVAMAVIFAWSNLFSFSARMAAPAPMMTAVPEAAMESASLADEAAAASPMIIFWGRPQAYGKGGGGGNDTSAMATDLGGYGGGPTSVIEEFSTNLSTTENPEASANLASTPDPSTLILGLPQPGTEGQTIQQTALETRTFGLPLQPSALWMIGMGAAALIFAVLAIFLRKR